MKTMELLSERYARLRHRAEARIKQWANVPAHAYADPHQVINELKIHLAEQEILNEELKVEMEARRLQDETRYESVRNMFWPLN